MPKEEDLDPPLHLHKISVSVNIPRGLVNKKGRLHKILSSFFSNSKRSSTRSLQKWNIPLSPVKIHFQSSNLSVKFGCQISLHNGPSWQSEWLQSDSPKTTLIDWPFLSFLLSFLSLLSSSSWWRWLFFDLLSRCLPLSISRLSVIEKAKKDQSQTHKRNKHKEKALAAFSVSVTVTIAAAAAAAAVTAAVATAARGGRWPWGSLVVVLLGFFGGRERKERRRRKTKRKEKTKLEVSAQTKMTLKNKEQIQKVIKII